jgi:hypothetical protein
MMREVAYCRIERIDLSDHSLKITEDCLLLKNWKAIVERCWSLNIQPRNANKYFFFPRIVEIVSDAKGKKISYPHNYFSRCHTLIHRGISFSLALNSCIHAGEIGWYSYIQKESGGFHKPPPYSPSCEKEIWIDIPASLTTEKLGVFASLEESLQATLKYIDQKYPLLPKGKWYQIRCFTGQRWQQDVLTKLRDFDLHVMDEVICFDGSAGEFSILVMGDEWEEADEVFADFLGDHCDIVRLTDYDEKEDGRRSTSLS